MKPIERLYIYELSGDLQYSPEDMGKGFLGCWREGGHSYLFYSVPAGNDIDTLLSKNPDSTFISETDMDYDQWEPADGLKSFDIEGISFIPSWEEAPDTENLVIRIDPGVVFGAGTHHTTMTCLKFLSSLMKNEKINRVLDLGTGTGILALAAAGLGAGEIIAVDNNNLAVETARKNAECNNFQSIIHCIHGDAAEYFGAKADLIMGNLVSWILDGLFRHDAVYQGTWYIVSGIYGTEVHDFKEKIKHTPLVIIQHEMDNLWSTLLLRRR